MSSEELLSGGAWLGGERVTGGIGNLGGTACFMNSIMQVFARLQPLVRLLGLHHCLAGRSCVLCKIRGQIADMRGGLLIARSPVVVATRRGGEFSHRLADDFVGDSESGRGPQCDAWEFCMAVVEEFQVWEKDRKRSRFRGEELEVRRRVEARPILDEHVWGALVRTRNRCAQCSASSDTLKHRQFIDLNMVAGVVTLKGLYTEFAKEFRGAETRCPSLCGGFAYQQYFLEKEPPFLFFRFLKYKHRADFSGYDRINVDIAVPDRIDFLRSGVYQLAAVVMHHGQSTQSGHYTTLCWEGAKDGEERYRWYNDAEVTSAMTWAQVRGRRYYDGSTIGFGAYILCYVRVCFWHDSVGDGSESVPYLRDGRSHDVAKSFFRGRPVALDLEQMG